MSTFYIDDSYFITPQDCPYILRRASLEDSACFDDIFEQCRQFMHSYGNTKQWTGNFPNASLMHDDIVNGNTVVCLDKNTHEILAFCNLGDEEQAYKQNTTVWTKDKPYVVIHRLAAKQKSKAGRFLIEHTMRHYNYIRLDTHQDNKPMIRLMQKLNYKYTGYVMYERNNADGHRITFDYAK